MDRDALGDWLLDAGLRRLGLRIIAAVEALIVDDDPERSEQMWAELRVNPIVLSQALGNLVLLLVSSSDDPAGLLLAAEMALIDRPPPPIPET
jgi:hypothetical protein